MFEIVYFSSTSENTKRFVEKLGLKASRIPLMTKDAAEFQIQNKSVLVVPTYGGGEDKKAVPVQVIKFLNNPDNRQHVAGVIAMGNTNFGETFCIAGDILADKLKVPLLNRVEILGTPDDVQVTKERIATLWQSQKS
jgi:protein involved in ribonucleotide reduction